MARPLGTPYATMAVPRAQSDAYVVPKYRLEILIVTNHSGDATADAMESAQ